MSEDDQTRAEIEEIVKHESVQGAVIEEEQKPVKAKSKAKAKAKPKIKITKEPVEPVEPIKEEEHEPVVEEKP